MAVAVLDRAEERRPAHQVVEVEAQVIVLGQGVEVGQVQREQVRGRDAPDGAHGEYTDCDWDPDGVDGLGGK